MLEDLKEAWYKIRYVFTKEYKQECEYIEFQKQMRDKFKLKMGNNERIEEKIARLKNMDLKEEEKPKVLVKW